MPRCHLEGTVPGVKGRSSSQAQEEVLSPHPPPPFLCSPGLPLAEPASSQRRWEPMVSSGEAGSRAGDMGRRAGSRDRRLCSETDGLSEDEVISGDPV